MRALIALGLAAAALASTAGTAAAATGLRIVEAGGTTYPHKAYVLTLPKPRALTASDVRLTENGVPVQGLDVVRQGTANSKSAVVLAIDESLSMRGEPLAKAFAAAREFAAQANPDEEIAIVTFNGSVDVLQPFTTDPKEVANALNRTPKLVYGTRIYDALQRSLQLISAANVSSGSVIILTDGQNVGGSAKPADTLGALAKAHVRVFPVGLRSASFQPASLQKMASATNGSYVVAPGLSELEPILLALGRQLSGEYLLSYTSRMNPDVRVSVRVAVKGVAGSAESSYTSPPLRIVPAPPYKPALVDQVIQSGYFMLVVVLVIAGLLWFAVSRSLRPRGEPLVERVGNFVSVQREARPENERRPPVQRRPRRSAGLVRRGQGDEARRSWTDRLIDALELADLEFTPGQVVLYTAVATAIVMVVLGLLMGPVGFVLGLGTPFLSRWLIVRRIARKRRRFAEQLPDNLDVLASALRAGHSLVGALTVVANDAAEPSKSEFRRVLSEEQFGAQLEDAFEIVVERMQNRDLEQVALVARLQREMGSNSAEVLDRVVETLRARMELRRLVRTLTAQGRLSRWVLTLLPVGVGLALSVVARGYMHPLFHERLGQVLLVIAVGAVILGSVIIKRIVEIRVV